MRMSKVCVELIRLRLSLSLTWPEPEPAKPPAAQASMAPAGKGLNLTPGLVVGATFKFQGSDEREWPDDVEHVPLPFWDTGTFLTELVNLNRLPGKLDLNDEEREAAQRNPEALFSKAQANAPKALQEGTYRGTQLALTKVYSLIESSYASFMDTANFEPSIPHPMTIEEKRQLFCFTDPATDGYPPHLNLAANKPASDMNPGKLHRIGIQPGQLHDGMRLVQLTALLPQLVPKTFIGRSLTSVVQTHAELQLGDMGRPDEGETFADVEAYNKRQRAKSGGFFERNDIFNLPNIGDVRSSPSDETIFLAALSNHW